MYKCVEYFIYDLKCFGINNSKLVLKFIEEITFVDILKNNRFIVAAVLI